METLHQNSSRRSHPDLTMFKQEVFIFPPLFRQTAALPCSSAILHIVSAFIHHRHNTMLISIQFVIMYKLKAKTPIHEFDAINTANNSLY